MRRALSDRSDSLGFVPSLASPDNRGAISLTTAYMHVCTRPQRYSTGWIDNECRREKQALSQIDNLSMHASRSFKKKFFFFFSAKSVLLHCIRSLTMDLGLEIGTGFYIRRLLGFSLSLSLSLFMHACMQRRSINRGTWTMERLTDWMYPREIDASIERRGNWGAFSSCPKMCTMDR